MWKYFKRTEDASGLDKRWLSMDQNVQEMEREGKGELENGKYMFIFSR